MGLPHYAGYRLSDYDREPEISKQLLRAASTVVLEIVSAAKSDAAPGTEDSKGGWDRIGDARPIHVLERRLRGGSSGAGFSPRTFALILAQHLAGPADGARICRRERAGHQHARAARDGHGARRRDARRRLRLALQRQQTGGVASTTAVYTRSGGGSSDDHGDRMD